MSKKTLGVILIIVGIIFITFGVWAIMPKTNTRTPAIYNEQNSTNTQVNNNTDINDVENVNVYTESNEQESTRYIY